MSVEQLSKEVHSALGVVHPYAWIMLLAFVVASLRMKVNREAFRLSEAMLCSTFALASSSTLDYLGMSQGFAIAVSCGIGYYGTSYVGAKVRSKIIDKGDSDGTN